MPNKNNHPLQIPNSWWRFSFDAHKRIPFNGARTHALIFDSPKSERMRRKLIIMTITSNRFISGRLRCRHQWSGRFFPFLSQLLVPVTVGLRVNRYGFPQNQSTHQTYRIESKYSRTKGQNHFVSFRKSTKAAKAKALCMCDLHLKRMAIVFLAHCTMSWTWIFVFYHRSETVCISLFLFQFFWNANKVCAKSASCENAYRRDGCWLDLGIFRHVWVIVFVWVFARLLYK